MADVAQLRAQIQTGRQQIVQARQTIQSQTPTQLTRQQLQRQTQVSGIRRKVAVRQFGVAKTKQLTKLKAKEKIFEESAKKTEAQIASYEASKAQRSRWDAARSLVRRRGAAAAYIAKGSDISSEVKQLLEASDIGGMGEEAFLAQRAGAPVGLGQVTVAEAQARAKIVSATKELAMISGTDFTPAKELKAQKQFSQVMSRAKTGEITPREQEVLTRAGVIQQAITPQVVSSVSFAESKLARDMGISSQASDIFKTSTRIPVIDTKTKWYNKGLTVTQPDMRKLFYKGTIEPKLGVSGVPEGSEDIRLPASYREVETKIKLTPKGFAKDTVDLFAQLPGDVYKAGAFTAEQTIGRLIPEGGFKYSPERATQVISYKEEAGVPSRLPTGQRMSKEVTLLTRGDVGKVGGFASSLGAFVVAPGTMAFGTTSHGIKTVTAPIEKVELLKTGKRPSGIKDDDWSKYERDIEEYNKSQIERQKVLRKQKAMGFVEIGIGGTILGLKAAKGAKLFFKQPIDTKVMKGADYTLHKYDASTKVYPGGVIAKGKIRTYVPPDRALYTTRARKLFGLKGKVAEFGKARKYITDYDLISGKVGAVGKYETVKVGSRQTVKGIFGGVGERITPEAFAKLPKSQQYIYQKLVEGKIGRPVSLKNVPKMLGKADLSRGSMFQIDRYKVGPQYKYVPKKGMVLDIGSKRYQLYDPKKSIKFYESVAKSEPGTTIGFGKKGGKELIRFKLEEGKVSLDTIGLKQIKPPTKSIARGRVTQLEGTTTYEYFDTPSSVFESTNLGKVKPTPGIYDLAQIGKPPIQTTVPKLTPIQKQAIQTTISVKPIPKIAPQNVPKIYTSGETGVGLTSQELAPMMVGGLGLGLSQYSKTDLTTISKPSLKTLPSIISKSRVGYIQKPISPQAVKPLVISTTVQKPMIITSQVVKPLTAQTYRQAQVFKPVVVQKALITTIPVVPTIRPLTPPPSIITGGYYRRPVQPKMKPRVQITKPTPQAYAVEVRKEGQWLRVARGLTKQEATAIGIKKTRARSVASFRTPKVKGKARKQKVFVAPWMSALYRPSKYEAGVTVQKRGLRILTPGEKREISYMGGLAVKGKKRKKKTTKKKGKKK